MDLLWLFHRQFPLMPYSILKAQASSRTVDIDPAALEGHRLVEVYLDIKGKLKCKYLKVAITQHFLRKKKKNQHKTSHCQIVTMCVLIAHPLIVCVWGMRNTFKKPRKTI